MKMDTKSGFGYAFIHFSVELVCFYILANVFQASNYVWLTACLFDILAFGLQPAMGAFCEKHPSFRPGPTGGVLLTAGALLALVGGNTTCLLFLSLVLITVGNGLVHISGALVTLRASEGRLSESAVFVGAGSFGLITGRLLGTYRFLWVVPFLFMCAATVLMVYLDKRLLERYGEYTFHFGDAPCLHNFTRQDRSTGSIVLVLFCIVCVRAYIGYGLPTAWNKTVIQTIFLYGFMGLGKMLGGILADRFGPLKTGVVSCLVAIPALLMGDNIMWLSLIGVALFSMTMAITLGGLVSALPRNPGIAFGVTTLGLLTGTVPLFFTKLPSRVVCDSLILILSLLAGFGMCYCIKKEPDTEG